MAGIIFERAAKIVTVVELVLHVLVSLGYLALFIAIGILGAAILNGSGPNNRDNDQNHAVGIGAFVITVIVCLAIAYLINLTLVVILWKGFYNRHVGKCNVWYIVQAVFTAFSVLSLIGSFFNPNWTIIISLAYVAYRIWSIHAVRSFSNALKESRYGNGAEILKPL